MTYNEFVERFSELAIQQADDECHYVWGAAGATPDGDGGIQGRPRSVSLLAPRLDANTPSVFTAFCGVDGRHICAGRYQRADGGRLVPAGDGDVVAYLESLQGTESDAWDTMEGNLTPRTLDNGAVVLGEDCRDTRHFDCVGLINWAVENARGKPTQFDIPSWDTNNSGTIAVPLDAPFQAGDILIRKQEGKYVHIGMMAAADDFEGVVEAASTELGVIKTEGYDPSAWTSRRRPTAALHGQ